MFQCKVNKTRNKISPEVTQRSLADVKVVYVYIKAVPNKLQTTDWREHAVSAQVWGDISESQNKICKLGLYDEFPS